MIIEDAIKVELEAAAELLPQRRHDFGSTLRTARRSLMWHRASVMLAAAGMIAIAAFGIEAVIGDARVGRSLAPGSGATATVSDTEVEQTVERFHSSVSDNDLERSWALLSEATRRRIGTIQDWRSTAREIRKDVAWILSPGVETTITRLPGDEAYLATYAAPVDGDSALLEVFTLVREGGEVWVDIVRDRDREVSLTPESPVFMACSVPCDPEELWPPVTDGQTFSVLLERTATTFTTTIDRVWFAVGGEWLGEARLMEGAKEVRAQVTFEPESVPEGENVFTVTVELSDGTLETYGYRVRYEGD